MHATYQYKMTRAKVPSNAVVYHDNFAAVELMHTFCTSEVHID